MKREEKNALSRQRILDAAMREFSEKGYDAASMNAICGENGISKGIVYHYFKDKDELYLSCAAECFNRLTAYLGAWAADCEGEPEARLRQYFDARLRFFAEAPVCLGLFLNAVLYPPAHLAAGLAGARREFDRQNIAILTGLLSSAPLRAGMTVPEVAEDLRLYMDFFNARARQAAGDAPPEQALREHEERRRRQLEMLLYGVFDRAGEAALPGI